MHPPRAALYDSGMIQIRTAAAVAKAGSQGKLAKLLGITRSAVSQWGEYLPELQAHRLRALKPRWMRDLTESP